MRNHGAIVYIISGGYTQIIRPTADDIGISSDNIYAVDLKFTSEGSYEAYDRTFPTTQSGGKIIIIEELKKRNP
jgi:phosphoserine phosphatase